jgi:hypothetical protein
MNTSTTGLKGQKRRGRPVGEDEKGRNGLDGLLRRMALRDPKSFASLLGYALQDEDVGQHDKPSVYKTEEEVRQALLEQGIPVDVAGIMAHRFFCVSP